MSTKIVRSALLAPVHAILYCASIRRIMVARGNEITVYDLMGNVIMHQVVFLYSSIHNLVTSTRGLIAFGQKSIALLSEETLQAKVVMENLDDLVLDATLLSTYFVIGYAHNIIDLFELSDDSASHVELSSKRRIIHCPISCVLFSMSLNNSSSSKDNELMVISGTAFGDIQCWRALPDVEMLYTVSRAHLGVVFGIKWNHHRTRFATTSDDRTVRVWNAKDGSSVFEGWGHTCRTLDTVFIGEGLLATSSEEGDVRLWDTNTHRCTVLRGHVKNAWRLVCIDSSPLLVSSGNDSTLRLWHLEAMLSLNGETLSGKSQVSIPVHRDMNSNRRQNGVNAIKVSPLGDKVVLVLLEGLIWETSTASRQSTTDGEAEEWTLLHQLELPIVSSDVCISHDGLVTAVCSHPNGIMTYVSGSAVITWKAHDLRVISVWFARPSYSDLVLTSSVRGHCILWRMDVEATPVLEVVTDKNAIASCCLLLTSITMLLVGDSRGSISVFKEASLLQCLRGAHGTEIVSAIQECEHGVVSLGHDGFVTIYAFHLGLLTVINKLSCLPLKSPDALWLVPQDNCRRSMFIGGFVGSKYIVHDICSSYELLSCEAGGWKRPHDCTMMLPHNSVPILTLAFSTPQGQSNDLCLVTNARVGVSRESFAMSIGESCTSLELYSTTILTTDSSTFVLAGGEEGRIKVFSKDVHNKLHVAQDLEMPHNVPVRAMCSSSSSASRSRGIVVAGGGRLMFRVFSYDAESSSPLQQVFWTRYSGTTWANATQDHRILAVQCTARSTEKESYLILLCDSRGVAKSAVFESGDVQFLCEFNASEYPILSCALHEVASVWQLSVIGDSSGIISVWRHSLLERDKGTSPSSAILLLQYGAHEMGANALDIRVTDAAASGESIELVVMSGGDDQSLCYCRASLKSAACIELVPLLLLRHESAVGSAIKGLTMLDTARCLSVGYDQRLIIWDIAVDDSEAVACLHSGTGVVSCAISDVFKYSTGILLSISDVEGMCCRDGYAVVVGQGLQSFSLSNDTYSSSALLEL